MRRAAKKDHNHTEIVAAFRAIGWTVLDISQLKNCCDLFVSKNGRTVAVEIKDGAKQPSQRKLTEGEASFRESWQGEYMLIESVDDALKLGGLRK